jgi:hypothetical protein
LENELDLVFRLTITSKGRHIYGTT